MSGLSGLGWIAVDWGTTNLRAWAMGPGNAVLARAESADGMGTLSRTAYAAALLKLVEGWLPAGGTVDVLACGMVGSRQGWVEAPYATVPCAPWSAGRLVRPTLSDPRLVVHVVPGLKQQSPADVMRGEETQIAGFLSAHPLFDGVLCLPGTHTKWAHISAGEVVSFQTYMTGEMFALMSEQSVLRHGMAAGGWDEAAFALGLDQAMSRPEKLAARLFAIRAEGLLNGLGADQARSRLSGLLIGAELAGAKPYWLGQSVVVIGAEAVGAAYVNALTAQGTQVRFENAEAMTLAGLAAARASLKVGVQ